MLGEAVGKTIFIDRDAAGYGWFVDPTPAADEEFTRKKRGQAPRKVLVSRGFRRWARSQSPFLPSSCGPLTLGSWIGSTY